MIRFVHAELKNFTIFWEIPEFSVAANAGLVRCAGIAKSVQLGIQSTSGSTFHSKWGNSSRGFFKLQNGDFELVGIAPEF